MGEDGAISTDDWRALEKAMDYLQGTLKWMMRIPQDTDIGDVEQALLHELNDAVTIALPPKIWDWLLFISNAAQIKVRGTDEEDVPTSLALEIYARRPLEEKDDKIWVACLDPAPEYDPEGMRQGDVLLTLAQADALARHAVRMATQVSGGSPGFTPY